MALPRSHARALAVAILVGDGATSFTGLADGRAALLIRAAVRGVCDGSRLISVTSPLLLTDRVKATAAAATHPANHAATLQIERDVLTGRGVVEPLSARQR